jgi:glycopeptide antibiotics resistance protein
LRRPIAAALLTIYLVVLLDLTLMKFPEDHPSPRLVPFATIVGDWRSGGYPLAVNLLGNVAAFVPLGVLLPTALGVRASAWRVVAAGAALSGSIELAQYASGRRVADVDDLILNTAGTLLGYAALRAARAIAPGRSASARGEPTR